MARSELPTHSVRPLSDAILRHLVPWLDLDWPLRWDALFCRPGPLVVEIGFGNGGFLTAQADRHPASNFVGIERAWGSAHRVFKRLDRLGQRNVRIVQGDAAYALRHLFAPGCIDRITINFPDPWPKERHHARRLIQPAFVGLLAERLKAGGEVTVATDHAGYAAWIAGVLEGQALLRSCFASTRVHELPDREPTKYEQKAISAGVPIHYFVWRREAFPSRRAVPERVGAMPNVILEGTCDRMDLLADFVGQALHDTHRGVRVVVKLVGVFRDARERHWLVETMVKEGELTQHFGVLVLLRPDGRLLVKLSPMGHPRPTWGVKQAVRLVAELVLKAHPGLCVASSTVGLEAEEG